MIVASSLLAYAILLLFVGQLVLSRLTRSGSAPGLGVLVWSVAGLSAVACWWSAALSFANPDPLHSVAHLLGACSAGVHEVVAAPGSNWLRGAGVIAAAAVLGRAIFVMLHEGWYGYRCRQRHARTLELVARPLRGRPAMVLEHATRLAYCLPGRVRKIVITRGALQALSEPQLDAVLEHERAHLAGRHHLPLAAARAVARAFPGIPLLAEAAREVRRLLEMCADDVAARRYGSAAVVDALRSLSSAPTPVGTLAAADSGAEERIARLTGGRDQRTTRRLATAVLLLLAGPIAAISAPILLAAGSG